MHIRSRALVLGTGPRLMKKHPFVALLLSSEPGMGILGIDVKSLRLDQEVTTCTRSKPVKATTVRALMRAFKLEQSFNVFQKAAYCLLDEEAEHGIQVELSIAKAGRVERLASDC